MNQSMKKAELYILISSFEQEFGEEILLRYCMYCATMRCAAVQTVQLVHSVTVQCLSPSLSLSLPSILTKL